MDDTLGLYKVPGQLIYDGMCLPERIKPDTMDRVKTYKFRPDDVIIATYPKSGTVWTSQIVDNLLKDGDTSLNYQQPLSDRVFLLELLSGLKTQVGMDLAEGAPSPRIFTTHVPYRYLHNQLNGPDAPKLIYVYRNIKDVLVSYYHFYQMTDFCGKFTGSFDDFFELFKAKHLIYGDWFEHVDSYLRQTNHPNIHLATYEAMKHDLKNEVQRMANFLGKNTLGKDLIDCISSEAQFEKMKKNPMVNRADDATMDTKISPFFRKGIIGDSNNYLRKEQHEYIDRLFALHFPKGFSIG